MIERLYCLRCMVTWAGERREDICPRCNIDNFFLLRSGDFGTTITFEQLEIFHGDFEEIGNEHGQTTH